MEIERPFDQRGALLADGKVRTVGKPAGGRHSFRARAKAQLAPGEIQRGGGEMQGVASVTVAAGACYGGLGAIRPMPEGAVISSEEYKDIVENACAIGRAEYFPAGDLIPQQDGAPAHTSKATQSLRADPDPKFTYKKTRPRASADLNPANCFLRAPAQQEVAKNGPVAHRTGS